MDRRQALKRVAAAGIAWTAPQIISSGPVGAVDVCTPKCAPQGGNVTVAGSWEIVGCSPGPPGQQPVNYRLSNVTLSLTGSCGPCGDADVMLLEPDVAPGNIVEGRPKPGAGGLYALFDVVFLVTCTDRSGDRLRVRCTAEATGVLPSGNCNSNVGARGTFTVTGAVCSAPSCLP